MDGNVRRISDACIWIEQDTSIGLKACDTHGDPLELTPDEARAIATALLELATELEGLDEEAHYGET